MPQGRKSAETVREKAAYWCGILIFMLYLVSAVIFGIFVWYRQNSFLYGIAFLALGWFLGIVLWPGLAAEGSIFAGIICVLFVFLIVLTVYLSKTKHKLTKAEKIKLLEDELLEKELEAAFPEIVELRQELEDIKKSQRQLKESIENMKWAIKSTSKDEIDRSFIIGKITKEEHDKKISEYETWETFVEREAELEYINDEIISGIQREIEDIQRRFQQRNK